MFKNKRIFAVLLAMMLVIGALPGMAFAAGGDGSGSGDGFSIGADVEAVVNEETVIEATFDGEYHVHWLIEGQTKKFESSVNKKGTKLTVVPSEKGKQITVTAQRYEGTSCDSYLCEGTMACPKAMPAKGKSKTITVTSIEGAQPAGETVVIKAGEEVISEGAVVKLDRWNTVELEASVTDKKYTFTWENDPKEVVNYIINGTEMPNGSADVKTATGEKIVVKGLVPDTTKVTVKAYNKDGELKGTITFDVKVKSDMEYAAQGEAEGGQSIEIIKLGDKFVTDEDIAFVDGTYNNVINNTEFDITKDTITFFVGKQVSLDNFEKNKADFIEYGLGNVVIKDSEGYVVPGAKFELVGQNIDRSITIKLVEGTVLEPGDYQLVFGKEFMPRKDGNDLGVDITFAFTVAADEAADEDAEPAIPEDNNQNNVTDEEQNIEDENDDDADNKTESENNAAAADKNADHTVKTGDNINMMLLFAAMIGALGVMTMAFRRSRQ